MIRKNLQNFVLLLSALILAPLAAYSTEAINIVPISYSISAEAKKRGQYTAAT